MSVQSTHQSIEATFALTGNGSTAASLYHGATAMDCLFCFNSGAGDVQLEVSVDGVTKWVPVGTKRSTSGMDRVQLPEGIYFRLTVTAAAGLDLDITVFDE